MMTQSCGWNLQRPQHSGLGRRLAEVSGEIREGSFIFQRLSLLIQRFKNAVLLHDCFVDEVAGHSS